MKPQVLYIPTDSKLYGEPDWFKDVFDRDGLALAYGDRYASEADNARRAPDADFLLVGSGRYPVTAETWNILTRCRMVVRMGAGYDTIDVPEATRRGVIVSNMPANIPEDVSDHAIALFLACLRHLGEHTIALRAGRWDHMITYPARRIRGQTMGLVGFGRIARLVTQKVAGFGLTIIAYDPYLKPEDAAPYGVELVRFDELLRRSDVVSIHAPATLETRGLFNAEVFAKMKPTAILINTARGYLIDEPALVAALREGKILAAGLDVFVDEPIKPDNPLLKLDRVVMTPHVAGWSDEGHQDYFHAAHRIASDFLLRGQLPGSVMNPDVLRKSS